MFQVPAGVGEFTSIKDEGAFKKNVDDVLKGEREGFDIKEVYKAKD